MSMTPEEIAVMKGLAQGLRDTYLPLREYLERATPGTFEYESRASLCMRIRNLDAAYDALMQPNVEPGSCPHHHPVRHTDGEISCGDCKVLIQPKQEQLVIRNATIGFMTREFAETHGIDYDACANLQTVAGVESKPRTIGPDGHYEDCLVLYIQC